MLKLSNINIKFDQDVVIEDGTFQAYPGYLTGLIGESGTGKSTLLDILGLKNYHQQFNYDYYQLNLKELSKSELNALKREVFAYITQTPEFISTMNCLDNIKLECEIAHKDFSKEKLSEILSFVGLSQRANAYPSQLSGGEKQRLAFAMALAKDTDVLLCDEITSHLDKDYAKIIVELLSKIAHQYHKIVILTTHDHSVIEMCDNIYEIKDKKLYPSNELPQKIVASPIEIPQAKLTMNFYQRIIFSRLKKRKLSYILTSIVCLISVTIMVFSQMIVSTALQVVNRVQYSNSENEIMILNKTFPTSYNFYLEDYYMPFEQATINQIQNLDFVNEMYPFFGFCITEVGNKDQKYVMTFSSSQGKQKVVPFDADGLFGEVVYPYYKEQHFEEKYSSTASGAFIDSYFASQLGISDIEEGMTMDIEIYVPIYTTNEVIESLIGEEIQRTVSCSSHYVKCDLTIPVAKILPETHYDPSVPKAYIYIPYDVFEQHYQDAISDIKLESGQSLYAPSYYKLFVDEDANRKEVGDTLQKLDENLYVDDPIWRSMAIKTTGTFEYFKVFSGGMLIAGGLMMFVYGFSLDEENHKDYQFYKTRGIGKKERRYIILGEWLALWLIVFPISVILNLIILSKNDMFYTYLFDKISLNTLDLLLYTAVIYGGMSLLSELIPLINAKVRCEK